MFWEAMSEINLLAVAASVVASFFFGGVWFGAVVSRLYVVALGMESLPVEKVKPLFIFGPAVCNLFVVLTSAVLMRALKIDSLGEAVCFGLIVGVGYLLSTCMNIAINPNFPRPFFYTLINAPYFVGSSILTSVLLVSI